MKTSYLQHTIFFLLFTLLLCVPLYSQRGRGGPGMGQGPGQHERLGGVLTEAQRSELYSLVDSLRSTGADREAINAAVAAKFEAWGIDMPERPQGGPGHGPNPFADLLNEEQRTELHALMDSLREADADREEIHAAVVAKFEAWGIDMPERPQGGPGHGPNPFANLLNEEQRTELHALMDSLREAGADREDIHAAVAAKFEAWGIEMPERPRDKMHEIMEQLTDEQRQEIHELVRFMREDGASFEDVKDAVDALLASWGIEVSDTDADDAAASSTSVEQNATAESAEFSASNYPNPFNPSTRITFNLAKPNEVSVRVYNINGQLIATLLNDYRNAGSYQVEWNGLLESGESAPSGIYFYRVESGSETQTGRMTLMK